MGHPVRKRLTINKFGHPQPSMCHSACCLVFFHRIVVLVNIYQIKQRISDYFEECFIDIYFIFNNLFSRSGFLKCGNLSFLNFHAELGSKICLSSASQFSSRKTVFAHRVLFSPWERGYSPQEIHKYHRKY